MIRALLFDMGGTLDGDGRHWLDRFVDLYAAAGVSFTRDRLRGAFDEAERRAAIDDEMLRASLGEMVERHVAWQCAHLELDDSRLRARLVERFVEQVRGAARTNVGILSALKARGFTLGVVSNGCGNVDVLCGDLGYAAHLSVVVDSRRVGLFKPDPAIYVYAAGRLGLPPPSIMMVGDSFDRDVLPARSAGMKTAWLLGPSGSSGRECADPSAVDVYLQALAELPAKLEAQERTVA